jgi:hypothetical protein
MARSILFFAATVTAVTCSAALPTMGRMIRPIKAALTLVCSTIGSIASLMKSAQTATNAVLMQSITTAAVRDMTGVASSCSASGPMVVAPDD